MAIDKLFLDGSIKSLIIYIIYNIHYTFILELLGYVQ